MCLYLSSYLSGFEVSTGWGWLDVGGLKLDMISFQFQTSISVIEMSFATLDNLSNLQKEINKDEALYFYMSLRERESWKREQETDAY